MAAMTSRLHAHIGTLRPLEILLAVYDCGSITAASQQLHLTQPTVSMQLKKLADTVGMPLYHTMGRKLIFTDAGRALVATAREVLDSFERLDMTLADLRGSKAGTLRIAVVTTSKYFIPHLLGPFCKRYPTVDIQFKVGNRQQIIERVEQGLDDFYVFSHPPEDIDIEKIEFLPNPLVAIASARHPLGKQKKIPLREFLQAGLLMREEGSGTRFAIEDHLRHKGVEPRGKLTIESNEAIKHAVMAGLGVGILSAHTLAFGGKQGLMVLDVNQLPIETHWYFVWLRSRRLSPVARTFLDYVTHEGREGLLAALRKHGFSE
jgi:LysR family transcriptional regulator, low CO2-responsive transcriptional regulator